MDGRIFLLITVLGGEKLCQCCPLHSIEGPKGIQGEIIATTIFIGFIWNDHRKIGNSAVEKQR